MKNNIGKKDRTVRVVVGCALIACGVGITGTAGIITAAVGLIPLLTGLAGNCPVYSILGVDTCKVKKGS